VTAFGAVADDLEPDDAAFAAALAARVRAGGGVVDIPEGRFELSRPVEIPPQAVNIVVRGRGPASLLHARFPGPVFRATRATNIRFEAFRISGTFSKGIFVSDSTEVTVRDCVIEGATDPDGGKAGALGGVVLSNVARAHIERNVLSGNGSRAFDIGGDIVALSGGTCEELEIVANRCMSKDVSYNIGLFNTRRSRIIGNHVSGARVFGEGLAGGYGIMLYRTPGGTSGENVVGENIVSETEGSGIYLQNAPHSIVAANVVIRAALRQIDTSLQVGGIAVGREGPVSITGNVVERPGSAGISVGGEGSTVVGNVVVAPAGAGIYLRDFQSGTVSGNSVDGGNVGIKNAPAAPTRGVLITSNVLRNWTTAGVQLEAAVDSHVVGNQASSEGAGIPILIKGCHRVVVTGNALRIPPRENPCDALRITETRGSTVEANRIVSGDDDARCPGP
jgi:hypothetical protein